MDDRSSSESELFSTLHSFKYVNRYLSQYIRILNEYLISKLLDHKHDTVTVLDLGAGGCDIPIWLASRCSQLKIPVKIICIDNDDRAISFAKSQCKHIPSIEILHRDFFEIDYLSFRVDYIISNHFIHHLDMEQIPDFFSRVYKCSVKGFILNDILRTPWAYALFTIAAGLFFRKGFVFNDGRISIRRSLKKEELERMIENSGLGDKIKIKTAIPFRLLAMSFKES